MPKKAPPCDASLIGKHLEIRWRYWRAAVEGERGKRKAVDIWADGTVVQVANDAADEKSPRFKIPAKFKGTNAVLVEWPPDPDREQPEPMFTWSLLTEQNWNKEAVLGWRYTAAQLAKLAETRERAGKRQK